LSASETTVWRHSHWVYNVYLSFPGSQFTARKLRISPLSLKDLDCVITLKCQGYCWELNLSLYRWMVACNYVYSQSVKGTVENWTYHFTDGWLLVTASKVKVSRVLLRIELITVQMDWLLVTTFTVKGTRVLLRIELITLQMDGCL